MEIFKRLRKAWYIFVAVFHVILAIVCFIFVMTGVYLYLVHDIPMALDNQGLAEEPVRTILFWVIVTYGFVAAPIIAVRTTIYKI